MLLIPAIDIKDGKCVRLRQGPHGRGNRIRGRPPGTPPDAGWTRGRSASTWSILTGRSTGRPGTARSSAPWSPTSRMSDVQVGGGIRDDDTIEGYLETGVRYVILGTRAVTTRGFVADACVEFPGHIIVGLDARDGRAAVAGWSKLSRHNVLDLARRIEDCGVEAIHHIPTSGATECSRG